MHMENTKKIKEDLIEELEGILKANKDNLYCDEYQIADMVREALKHPLWAPAMALQINSKKVKYFRWHDSGDVQNLDHLNKIYEVCRLSPDVKHWMPTREAWVKDHLASCPDNLIIRLSAPMVDQAAPSSWPHTSTVVTSGRTCPAPDQGNQCKDCRACWDKDVKNIAYGEH